MAELSSDPQKEKYAHIIGIGNLTRLDDGVAIQIIERLRKKNIPSNVKVTDLGTGGIDIILALDGWEKGIIIDAVDLDYLHPGAIVEYRIKEENIPEIKGLSSTHGFDAITALKLAFTLQEYDLPSEIRIIGVQVKNLDGLGTNLSSEVESAIPKVIQRIAELLQITF